MPWNVYIIESLKNGKYYIGVTSNIQERLKTHNKGLSKATKPWRPWKLIQVEQFKDIKGAYRRERFLKSKKSKKILNLIVKNKTKDS